MSYIRYHLMHHILNTLRPGQNGRHFADDIFKCIFLNENVWISIKISPKFVPQGPVNNILALAQVMASRRPGDKPLSGPMKVRLPTHICVTRPQWVKWHLLYGLNIWISVTVISWLLRLHEQKKKKSQGVYLRWYIYNISFSTVGLNKVLPLLCAVYHPLLIISQYWFR